MPHVPLRKTRNYFISCAGYVFKIENGEEKVIKAFKTRSKRIVIFIDKKQFDLLYLMMEHFDIKYTPSDRVDFKVNKDLHIPLSSISVKPFLNQFDLCEEDERLLFKFKCERKATSANQRSIKLITPVQVFYSLKIHGYKCVYCGRPLEPEIWHLDHFVPLSNRGGNVFENVVPSCNVCNIMKGALDGNQFYAQCRRIAEKCFFAGKDILEAPLTSQRLE